MLASNEWISNMQKTPSRLRVLALALSAALLSSLFVALTPVVPAAEAADLTTFDPGLIITDEAFYDSTTMSASDVQRWLTARDPSCADYTSKAGTKYVCLKNYTMKSTSRAADANCAAYTGKTGESAASIIYRVAKVCGINPQVLLVTLQKEQGFITGGARASSIYRKAMGYGCPDTAQCDSKYYGFFNQVYSAAWQFEQYRLNPVRAYQAGKTNTINYSTKAGCPKASVYIRNQATAGLYNYTPYVPNNAALSAGYGLGDKCSSYGNRNFYNYFSDWFGNPGNLLKNSSFSDGEKYWASGSTGSPSRTVLTNADNAQSGSRYLVVSTAAAGRRIEQTYKKSIANGNLYNGGVWVRADAEGATVEGRVLIMSVGGKSEVAKVPFTATSAEWTFVSLSLPIQYSGHSSLKLSVELTTPSEKLRVDSAELYLAAKKVVPRLPLTVEQVKSGSGSNGGWKRSTSRGLKLVIASATPVFGKYLAIRSTSSNDYVSQTIKRTTAVGTSYTTGMWVRSSSATVPYKGRIGLTTVGGTAEKIVTDFTVGNEWTYITTTLDIARTGHSGLRLYLYPDTSAASLHVDQITLDPNLSRGTSFETSLGSLLATPASVTVTSAQAAAIGSPVRDGRKAIEVLRTATTSAYVQVEISRRLGSNDIYHAGFWVKSAEAGVPFEGTLQLQGRRGGADTELKAQAFTATDDWQYVTVDYPVTKQRLNLLRVIVRLDSPTAHLYVDGITLH